MNGEWGMFVDITSFVSTLFPPLSESERNAPALLDGGNTGVHMTAVVTRASLEAASAFKGENTIPYLALNEALVVRLEKSHCWQSLNHNQLGLKVRGAACCVLIADDLLQQVREGKRNGGGRFSSCQTYVLCNAANRRLPSQGKILATSRIGFFPSDAVRPCPCVSAHFTINKAHPAK